MCKLINKLVLSNYTFDKWAEEQAKTDNPSVIWKDTSIDKKNEIISKFTTTRFMKLLYFTCLASAYAERKKAKEENREFEIEKTLFHNFDDWVAYENGPVAQSVYDRIGQFPTIDKKDGIFSYNANDLTESMKGLSAEKARIDDSIKKLIADKIPFTTKDNIDDLIWLSHAKLWNIALWEDKVLFVNDPYLLGVEIDEFDNRIKEFN